jgi:soluble lytic murein transglycosylase-like protein
MITGTQSSDREVTDMPTYNWRGQKINAPSLEAVKKYINKQHTAGIKLSKGDTQEALLARMRPYISDIYKAEEDNGLPPGMLRKVLYQESQFREDIILGNRKSRVGATGIAQFMPATAEEQGVDPLDPKQAIHGAAKYLSSLKEQTGSWEGAVAAYNWGPGNVASKGIENAPQETQDYLVAVLGGDQDADK